MIKNKISNDLTLENIRQVIKEEVTTVVEEQLKPINFRLGTLEEKVDAMDQKFEKRFDESMTGIDKLLGFGKNHDEQHASNELAHQRFDDEIKKLKGAGGHYLIA